MTPAMPALAPAGRTPLRHLPNVISAPRSVLVAPLPAAIAMGRGEAEPWIAVAAVAVSTCASRLDCAVRWGLRARARLARGGIAR